MPKHIEMHGRDHLANGADPIPGIGDAIRFNVDNEGGSLQIVANDPIPSTDNGIEVSTTDGLDIEITSDGNLDLMADSTSVHGSFGAISTGAIYSQNSSGVTVRLFTGKSLLVEDNGGNPIFRIDENGDLHGKTGKALTFDL